MSRFGPEKVPDFVHYFFRELFCNSPTNKTIFSALQLAGGIVTGADGVGDIRSLAGGIANGIHRDAGSFQRSSVKFVGACAHSQHDVIAGDGHLCAVLVLADDGIHAELLDLVAGILLHAVGLVV